MALPTTSDAKSYLGVEHTSDDTLIGQLLARAQALIEALLGYALTAVERTHVDYEEFDNYGVPPILRLPGPFKLTSPAPVVTDVDGATVSSSEYNLDARGLMIRAKPGYSFPNRPYTIVATIGLSAHPDYTAKYEAVASTGILDLVAHLYQNRNPAATQQTDEGGATIQVAPDAIPARIVESLEVLPGGGLLLR